MSDTHIESYDILTSRDDSTPPLTLGIQCYTAEEHYQRTTFKNKEKKEAVEAVACSTGLRVYEGAQLLSCFLYQYMDSLTHLLFTDDHRNVIIEIGCGCGLVGMTACTVLQEEQHHNKNNNHITYIYTDAEEDCLALVRASGAVNNERKHNTLLSICDGTKKSDMCVSDHGLCQLTFPLCWGGEGVDTLRTFLNEKMNSHYSMPLILGSDLIYYNVNLTVLLRTCQSLFSTGSGNSKYRFLLLAHYVRIPNGHEVLYQTAKDLNFKIVKINLHSFLDSARIQERGWGSAELVLLVYTTAEEEHTMQEDVASVKQILLEKRNTAAPSVQQQLDTLHQHVEPYLGTSDKNTEEEMLLLFNDL